MSIFSKIFRPISDHFRPMLKCPETKDFGTFGAKFPDLKRSEEIRVISCKTLFRFVTLHCNREARRRVSGDEPPRV